MVFPAPCFPRSAIAVPGLLPGCWTRSAIHASRYCAQFPVSTTDVIHKVIDKRLMGITAQRLDDWSLPGIVSALRNLDAAIPLVHETIPVIPRRAGEHIHIFTGLCGFGLPSASNL